MFRRPLNYQSDLLAIVEADEIGQLGNIMMLSGDIVDTKQLKWFFGRKIIILLEKNYAKIYLSSSCYYNDHSVETKIVFSDNLTLWLWSSSDDIEQ